MTKKFLRRTWNRYSKLGRKKKKKQIWRKPKGRDNKMREKRKGYPAVVKIGYKTNKNLRGTIENKKPRLIKNIRDLDIIKKNEMVIVGSVGKRKKIEIAKKAKEKGIQIYNLNIKKFLKKNAKKEKDKELKTSEIKKDNKKKEDKKDSKNKNSEDKKWTWVRKKH